MGFSGLGARCIVLKTKLEKSTVVIGAFFRFRDSTERHIVYVHIIIHTYTMSMD